MLYGFSKEAGFSPAFFSFSEGMPLAEAVLVAARTLTLVG
jgi:hypothetical protein